MTKFAIHRSFFAKRSGRVHRCLFRHQQASTGDKTFGFKTTGNHPHPKRVSVTPQTGSHHRNNIKQKKSK